MNEFATVLLLGFVLGLIIFVSNAAWRWMDRIGKKQVNPRIAAIILLLALLAATFIPFGIAFRWVIPAGAGLFGGWYFARLAMWVGDYKGD